MLGTPALTILTHYLLGGRHLLSTIQSTIRVKQKIVYYRRKPKMKIEITIWIFENRNYYYELVSHLKFWAFYCDN